MLGRGGLRLPMARAGRIRANAESLQRKRPPRPPVFHRPHRQEDWLRLTLNIHHGQVVLDLEDVVTWSIVEVDPPSPLPSYVPVRLSPGMGGFAMPGSNIPVRRWLSWY